MIHPSTVVIVAAAMLASVGVLSAARGENAPKAAAEDEVRTVRLVLTPAAEPLAALKYRLLPGVLDCKPGNAAVMYNKLGLMLAENGQSEAAEKIAEWIDVPLAELPREEVRATLDKFKSVLEGLELAARRDQCDWQLPIREQDFISLLLPELQRTRQYGRLLALQARLQIAEGKLDDAVHTLQTGYALARHVAEGPTLVSGLVGVAIAQLMSGRVLELIQQPQAPNLYWALTSLPTPLADMRPGIETEMGILCLAFPELRDLDRAPRNLEYYQGLIDKISGEVTKWQGVGMPELGWRPALTAMAIRGYPAAKRALVREGFSAQEVEAMPVPQAVALSAIHTYEELRDRMFKWFYIPYWQAQSGLAEVQRYIETEGKSREVIPLASLLLPAIGQVRLSQARDERSIALLRTIEAMRAYGAAHQNRLPAKLGDVTELPVPVDPMTGQAFVYRVEGDTAVLESAAPPGKKPRDYGVRYEITFRR
jgi:hypothetical protein